MHLDPLLPQVVGVAFCVLVMGALLRMVKQPHAIGYLLAGVLLGPHGLGWVDDEESTQRLGAVGVVILLFFVGMEVSLARLVERWRLALFGTAFQVAGSVAFVAVLGAFLDWPFKRTLLLGFVVSLSSTAVVINLLRDHDELETPMGQDVLSILLAQDLAIVPMLLTIQLMGGQALEPKTLALQIGGAVAFLAALAWLATRKELHLPLGKRLRSDHELQVFAALILCFGLALLTGLLGLSTALGAFLAGVIVSTARETHWVTERLESFRTVFVALFFFSVGMLIDLGFVRDNLVALVALLFGVLITNTLLNAAILRGLGRTWRTSLQAGALLAQIGEFSFVLVAVGLQAGFVTTYAYQATVATIALTLIASPFWVAIARPRGASSPRAPQEDLESSSS